MTFFTQWGRLGEAVLPAFDIELNHLALTEQRKMSNQSVSLNTASKPTDVD